MTDTFFPPDYTFSRYRCFNDLLVIVKFTR